MSRLFTTIIIMLFCIALCVNFINFTVSGAFMDETVRTVSYSVIVQDFSEISEDASILFSSFTQLGKILLDVCDSIYDYIGAFDFSESRSAVDTIKTVLVLPVRLFASLATLFGGVLVCLFDVGSFVYSLSRDIINIFNHLLGFSIADPGNVSPIGGGGSSGGGFGGRR